MKTPTIFSGMFLVFVMALGMIGPACDDGSVLFNLSQGDWEAGEGDVAPEDNDGPADEDRDTDDVFADGDFGDGDDVLDGGEDADVADASDQIDQLDEEIELVEGVDQSRCANAIPLQCGDRFSHSMADQGLLNQWFGYSCTQRGEGGPEVIYSFQSDVKCQVKVKLTNLHADLDLLLLDACDPWRCIAASSTPLDIQQDEEIRFTAEAGRRYLVVVDGYADATDSYTISVDCACEPTACQDAGGLCIDYSDYCPMATRSADHLPCDLGVCCIPMTCSEAGASCFSGDACPEGWIDPRYGDTFTCEGEAVCCVQADGCPAYRSALAQCPFQYFHSGLNWPDCPELLMCLDEPCHNDDNCILMDSAQLGGLCVTGNCVYCWQDNQCPDTYVCRGGRCVHRGTDVCPAPPPCNLPGCSLVELSETSCTTCVCNTIFDDACDNDEHCQPMAHHYFQHCVNGRCAECRNDDDCENGLECLPPGLCYSMTVHPSALYGSWLIGWWGGMDHGSYFRFEPDGTLRRGFYEPEGTWDDSIYFGWCYPGDEPQHPLIGAWEPEVTQSGLLIIDVDYRAWCPDSATARERFSVTVSQGGDFITLVSVDHPGSIQLEGWRVDPSVCTPDFAECDLPEFPGY